MSLRSSRTHAPPSRSWLTKTCNRSASTHSTPSARAMSSLMRSHLAAALPCFRNSRRYSMRDEQQGDRPKLLGDPLARDQRRLQLAELHVAPLAQFVAALRVE